MDRYCVVLCGLQAGVSEESATWSPVASALKLNQAEFAERVIAALPLIVRRDLDQAAAERIVQLLHAMHADARALPDDEQLVYLRHADAVRGPLPQSALGDFIQPGDTYQLRGSSAWIEWLAPSDEEPTATDADDLQQAAPSITFAEDPVEAPHENLSSQPPSDDEHEATINTPADEPADTDFAAVDNDPPQVSPPALPGSSSAQDQAPEAASEVPTDMDESTVAAEPVDDELINPLDEAASTDPDADALPAAEAAGVRPPTRSRGTRLVLLLVLAGLAYWAYSHWNADTRDSQPPSAATTSQASTSTTTDKLVAPEQTTPASDAKPAAATSAATATSAPIPATSMAPATATSAQAAAASTPAASASALAASISTAQARHDLPIPAVISPAAATSAAKPKAAH